MDFFFRAEANDELEIASKAAEMLGVLVEVFLENVTHQKIMIHSFQRNIKDASKFLVRIYCMRLP